MSDRDPDAGARKLADLVDYAPGSVVSRSIVKKKSGNITLFAFDRGEGLSEHTAPFDAFVLVLDGEAEITIDDQSHRIMAGETILMPANRPHALRAVKAFKMMLVMIRSE